MCISKDGDSVKSEVVYLIRYVSTFFITLCISLENPNKINALPQVEFDCDVWELYLINLQVTIKHYSQSCAISKLYKK